MALIAKKKMAPLRTVNIHNLELYGAVLLIKLIKKTLTMPSLMDLEIHLSIYPNRTGLAEQTPIELEKLCREQDLHHPDRAALSDMAPCTQRRQPCRYGHEGDKGR